MNAPHLQGIPLAAKKTRHERVFFLLFLLSFPFFLLVALLGRINTASESMNARVEKSIIAEASVTARSTIAIVLTN
jgi:hypothetical protein